MELKDYVTVAEAAEIMGKSANLVGKLVREGRLQGAQKMGKAGWLIPRDSVINYAPQQRRGRTRQERIQNRKEQLLQQITSPKPLE